MITTWLTSMITERTEQARRVRRAAYRFAALQSAGYTADIPCEGCGMFIVCWCDKR